jgi:hypothetical protein
MGSLNTDAVTFEMTDGAITNITAGPGWIIMFYEDKSGRRVDLFPMQVYAIGDSHHLELRRILDILKIQHISGYEGDHDGSNEAAWTLIRREDIIRVLV